MSIITIKLNESPEPKTKQFSAISTNQLTTLDLVSHVTKTTHENFYIFAGAEEQCATRVKFAEKYIANTINFNLKCVKKLLQTIFARIFAL